MPARENRRRRRDRRSARVRRARVRGSRFRRERPAALCAAGAGPRAPAPVPKDLEAAVARTFGLPVELVRRGAFVRCAGDRLLACAIGANLNCGKANTRRSLPGASEFCRANPGADYIPMFATGHDTIYAWRCVGKRAVAGKALVPVDAHGYDAGNWKEVGSMSLMLSGASRRTGAAHGCDAFGLQFRH